MPRLDGVVGVQREQRCNGTRLLSPVYTDGAHSRGIDLAALTPTIAPEESSAARAESRASRARTYLVGSLAAEKRIDRLLRLVVNLRAHLSADPSLVSRRRSVAQRVGGQACAYGLPMRCIFGACSPT